MRIDDRLLREAKKIAAETGRTLAAVIEDLLRESLARRSRKPRSGRVRLPTFKGEGLLPGVDLDDSAGLLEHMEGTDASP